MLAEVLILIASFVQMVGESSRQKGLRFAQRRKVLFTPRWGVCKQPAMGYWWGHLFGTKGKGLYMGPERQLNKSSRGIGSQKDSRSRAL